MTHPPRLVPTLTEIVDVDPLHSASRTAMAGVSLQVLEAQMVARILQRVELSLDRLLREALGRLILEQTQALVPRLNQEVEKVVRETVHQAFSQEAAALPAPEANS